MIGPRPVCLECRHFHTDAPLGEKSCTAFPEGIPDIVWTGGHDHKTAISGDGGIRFEPLEETEE